MKSVLFSLVLMFGALQAHADRSVSIAAADGKLKLINPTAANVTYTVECYDKTTGSNIISGGSNQTLLPKKSVDYVGGAFCTSGSPSKTLNQGPVFCPGSVTYASAAGLCGAGNHLCTIAEASTLALDPTEFLGYYWMSPGAAVDPFYTTYDAWVKNNNPNATTGGKPYAPMTTSKSPSQYRCSTGSAGSGSAVQGCQSGSQTTNYSGALCCPPNNGFVSCKVTIHGSGAAAGHLQSPQFKGGSSF